ncbi:hypothetical protein FGO68_gene3283 [Halteria grandinella]|uniref:Uncharacterized protein n=1 Tax=Halteria grandinella TaxID=5974 RepID=A0A8J8P0J9_HALGN|nr:hypothetical protein FGO68_gene3283 [Halteria grandinella]
MINSQISIISKECLKHYLREYQAKFNLQQQQLEETKRNLKNLQAKYCKASREKYHFKKMCLEYSQEKNGLNAEVEQMKKEITFGEQQRDQLNLALKELSHSKQENKILKVTMDDQLRRSMIQIQKLQSTAMKNEELIKQYRSDLTKTLERHKKELQQFETENELKFDSNQKDYERQLVMVSQQYEDEKKILQQKNEELRIQNQIANEKISRLNLELQSQVPQNESKLEQSLIEKLELQNLHKNNKNTISEYEEAKCDRLKETIIVFKEADDTPQDYQSKLIRPQQSVDKQSETIQILESVVPVNFQADHEHIIDARDDCNHNFNKLFVPNSPDDLAETKQNVLSNIKSQRFLDFLKSTRLEKRPEKCGNAKIIPKISSHNYQTTRFLETPEKMPPKKSIIEFLSQTDKLEAGHSRQVSMGGIKMTAQDGTPFYQTMNSELVRRPNLIKLSKTPNITGSPQFYRRSEIKFNKMKPSDKLEEQNSLEQFKTEIITKNLSTDNGDALNFGE